VLVLSIPFAPLRWLTVPAVFVGAVLLQRSFPAIPPVPSPPTTLPPPHPAPPHAALPHPASPQYMPPQYLPPHPAPPYGAPGRYPSP
jgi:hypothetical protein